MTYFMYFIQTLIIRCTVFDIFAEIDLKDPNWTFLALKMTFGVIPYLSYFGTGFVSQQRSYMIHVYGQLTCRWILSIRGLSVLVHQLNLTQFQAFKLKVDTGRTTDESALEKLRCLPAGGTKKGVIWDINISLKKGIGGVYLHA